MVAAPGSSSFSGNLFYYASPTSTSTKTMNSDSNDRTTYQYEGVLLPMIFVMIQRQKLYTVHIHTTSTCMTTCYSSHTCTVGDIKKLPYQKYGKSTP